MYCGSYISLLRDRSVTTLLYDRSPFLYFYQSDMGIGYFFLIYRLSGGNIHRYNSFGEVFDTLNLDVVIRLLILFFTLLYMIVPIYLILRYSEGFKVYLRKMYRTRKIMIWTG